MDVPVAAVTNLIRENLNDRYRRGFPVIKELIQNADDAGATRFDFGISPGLPQASHPLLQGPALVVANNGRFTAVDAAAINSIGLSSKPAEHATIGKFGLGLKSIFHFCEAFFYFHSEQEVLRLVNPWAVPGGDGIQQDNLHPAWNALKSDDAALVRAHLSGVFGYGAVFCLWIPLRQQDHSRSIAAITDYYPGDTPTMVHDLLAPEDGAANLYEQCAALMPLLAHLQLIQRWDFASIGRGKVSFRIQLQPEYQRRRPIAELFPGQQQSVFGVLRLETEGAKPDDGFYFQGREWLPRTQAKFDELRQSPTLTEGREEAVRRFLEGEVRFLVSTEAGGEGIDLQEQCHTLIHVDLPWNPMRLHQRVGRLNRYGQTQQVEVLTVRNPDTVESRIWDKLNAKIDNIKLALNQVMDEPEDLLQLVLGMTSPNLFTDIFADADSVPHERLNDWFNQRTAQFGGRDVIQTVRELVGNAARFDYQQVSDQLPQVDLDALAPFFDRMLRLNNRRPRSDENGLSFKTPDAWMDDPAMLDSYEGMVFDRKVSGRSAAARVLGVGSRPVNAALQQARSYPVSVTAIPAIDLPQPLLVFRIYDRITGSTFAQSVAAGVQFDPDTMTAGALLPDWRLLLELNKLVESRGTRMVETPSAAAVDPEGVTAVVAAAQRSLEQQLDRFGLPFARPEVELFAVLWPLP